MAEKQPNMSNKEQNNKGDVIPTTPGLLKDESGIQDIKEADNTIDLDPKGENVPVIDDSVPSDDESNKSKFADKLKEIEEEEEPGEESEQGYSIKKIAAKLVKDGLLLPYDEEKPIEKYTVKEIEQLLRDNIQYIKEEAEEKVLQSFLEELPDELKIAIEHYSSGGDIKEILRKIADKKETENKLSSSEDIVREYLKLKGYEDEEIEDEISTYKKAGVLDSKAEKYKDKVLEEREKRIKEEMEKAKKMEEAREKYAKWYINEVNNVIKKGVIKDISLPNDIKNDIKSYMTELKYKSPLSGQNTTYLNYLLEKYSVVEPDIERMIEVTWLLADRDGYIKSIRDSVEKEVKTKQVKLLKTHTSKGTSTGLNMQDDEDSELKVKKEGDIRTLAKGWSFKKQ